MMSTLISRRDVCTWMLQKEGEEDRNYVNTFYFNLEE